MSIQYYTNCPINRAVAPRGGMEVNSMTRCLRPPLADKQEDMEICFCFRCAGEVYPGEIVFDWENQRICTDCFQSAVQAWLKETPLEVAEELSVEFESV